MGNTPIRVLINISRKSSYWSEAWQSTEDVIIAALKLMIEHEVVEADAQMSYLFLARERWNKRVFIVFDIFNDRYDAATAHLPGQNDLPVTMVLLSERQKSVSCSPGTQINNKVNKDIRDIHDSMGQGSKPPFTVDHADGQVPYYPNPRCCTVSNPPIAMHDSTGSLSPNMHGR
jgi:hypothetical protein